MSGAVGQLVHVAEETGTGIVPASDMDAEAAVISACLVDPEAYGRVADLAKPARFFSDRHRLIMEAIVSLADERRPVDPISVGSWLNERGLLNAAGTSGYITEVLAASPVPRNVREHATAVHNAWRVRCMRKTCAEILARIDNGRTGELGQFFDAATDRVGLIASAKPDVESVFVDDAEDEVRGDITEKSRAPKHGELHRPALYLGLPKLDEQLGGLFDGEKTLLVARPGVGKSTILSQVLKNATEAGVGCVLYSFEMGAKDFAMRRLANRDNVSVSRIQRARVAGVSELHVDEWDRVVASTARRRAPLLIRSNPEWTIDDVCADLRRLVDSFFALSKAKTGKGATLRLAGLDFIQKVPPPARLERLERHRQVAYASQKFTNTLKELRLHGLEAAQAKTSGDQPRGRPDMLDIEDSKWPAKIAENVIHFYRPDKRDKTFTRAFFAKVRNNEAGAEVNLRLHGAHGRFEEL